MPSPLPRYPGAVDSEKFLELLGHISQLDVDYSEATLDAARADKSGHRSDSPPLAVVYPRSVDAVQETMRLAWGHSVPVVTRGGGSGLAGGAIGQAGELVVSLERLNAILEISVPDRLARVQAGVINSDLNAAAHEHGLWFAPDPASRQWSSVGGNIATNAGGLLCAKYGVTKESVLELTVVLADGSLLSTGHRSVKGVAGFDLTSLFVGSEGLLGIIVEATVKLLPISPHETWTLSARFDDIDSAAAACARILEDGWTPAVLELIDDVALAHIHTYLGIDAPANGEVLVIAQSDTSHAHDEVTAWADVCARHHGVTETSPPGDHAEHLLTLRRSMHPAMEQRGTVLIEDVAVPRSQLGAMFAEIRRIESDRGIEIPTVAHAADGNLHPNFIVHSDEVPEHIWDAAGELFQSALGLGGTLTGEHGVGLLKKRWLADELGDVQWQLQKEIKGVFDPQGLLNPGKVF